VIIEYAAQPRTPTNAPDEVRRGCALDQSLRHGSSVGMLPIDRDTSARTLGIPEGEVRGNHVFHRDSHRFVHRYLGRIAPPALWIVDDIAERRRSRRADAHEFGAADWRRRKRVQRLDEQPMIASAAGGSSPNGG
jgi:hypothetical protein